MSSSAIGVVKATGSGSITEGTASDGITANMQDAPICDAVHIRGRRRPCTYVYRLLRRGGAVRHSTSGINVAGRGARGTRSWTRAYRGDGAVRHRSKYLTRLFNRDWLAQKGLLTCRRCCGRTGMSATRGALLADEHAGGGTGPMRNGLSRTVDGINGDTHLRRDLGR